MDSNPEVPADMMEFLQKMLQGPVSRDETKPEAFSALVRSMHRLGRLREELRSADDSTLEYVNASIGGIVTVIKNNLDEAGSREFCNLGIGSTGKTMLEARIVAAQLHGWLENVVSNIEAQRETENILGGKLTDLLSEARIVPEAAEPLKAATGMYL